MGPPSAESRPVNHDHLPPSEIQGGKYVLGEHLGAGAFGTVLQAKDTQLNRSVAIKRINLQSDEHANWLREAQRHANLRHEQIVVVYDAFHEGSFGYIVMELMSRGSLRNTAGGLAIRNKIKIVGEIAGALEHVHEMGIFHRDIKPENILLGADGGAKLGDFGLALRTASAAGSAGHERVGTPGYMSPEQERGEPIDRRSDIYSLGIVLAELLSNAPFAVLNDRNRLRETLLEQPLRPDLTDICLRAIDPDPKKRYQSVGEFADALDVLIHSRESQPGRAAPPPPAPPVLFEVSYRVTITVSGTPQSGANYTKLLADMLSGRYYRFESEFTAMRQPGPAEVDLVFTARDQDVVLDQPGAAVLFWGQYICNDEDQTVFTRFCDRLKTCHTSKTTQTASELLKTNLVEAFQVDINGRNHKAQLKDVIWRDHVLRLRYELPKEVTTAPHHFTVQSRGVFPRDRISKFTTTAFARLGLRTVHIRLPAGEYDCLDYFQGIHDGPNGERVNLHHAKNHTLGLALPNFGTDYPIEPGEGFVVFWCDPKPS